MMGEFYVEVFSQQDKRFGIKTRELGDSWINGFNECPQVIKEHEMNNIPYHKVEKNDKVYYNYGEPKPKITDELSNIRREVAELKTEVEILKEAYAERQKS